MIPSAKPLGSPFLELHTVESTNNYAMGLVHARMAQHGLCVFAHEQTKGRGQRQKQWLSARGQNILLSVVVQPYGLKPDEQFLLSMAAALGTHGFFSRYAGNETTIKWPNDLYWRDRKAGGILIDTSLQGTNWNFAVIGIGLNLNQTEFPQLQHRAVSLRQITGSTYHTVAMAKELVQHLQEAFEQLAQEPASIHPAYEQRLYKRHETVKLKKGSRVFEALIKGVSPTGRLVVEHGLEESFAVGEVEWVG